MINEANLNGQIKCSVLMLSYFTFFYECHPGLTSSLPLTTHQYLETRGEMVKLTILQGA